MSSVFAVRMFSECLGGARCSTQNPSLDSHNGTMGACGESHFTVTETETRGLVKWWHRGELASGFIFEFTPLDLVMSSVPRVPSCCLPGPVGVAGS